LLVAVLLVVAVAQLSFILFQTVRLCFFPEPPWFQAGRGGLNMS
jgi:hypothetical protein